MTEFCTPFSERMRLACDLIAVQPAAVPLSSRSIASSASSELDRLVSVAEVDAWLSGEILPARDERAAIARILGFLDDFSLYLVSDDAAVVGPYQTQVETFILLAENGTGLVALRRSKPLDDEAIRAVRRLA